MQGIVTRTDLLEAVAGDLPKIDAPARPKVTRRDDGTFLIDVSVAISDVADLIGRQAAPPGDFVTLGGFLMSELQQMPKPGDHLIRLIRSMGDVLEFAINLGFCVVCAGRPARAA